MFHTIVRWSPKLVMANRLIWVRCTKLPLHALEEEILVKVVLSFGSLVTVDQHTQSMEKI